MQGHLPATSFGGSLWHPGRGYPISRFTIDQAGYRLLTEDPNGPTGTTMLHTLNAIRDDVIQRQQQRIGKVVYRTTAGITRNSQGLIGSVTMRKTAPHVIVPRRHTRLVFVPRGHVSPVYAKRVNHPGSTPPAKFLLDALHKATVVA